MYLRSTRNGHVLSDFFNSQQIHFPKPKISLQLFLSSQIGYINFNHIQKQEKHQTTNAITPILNWHIHM